MPGLKLPGPPRPACRCSVDPGSLLSSVYAHSRHTVTLSRGHTVTLSHCHAVTLSHFHTVTVSRCVCDCVTRGAGVCLGLGVTVSTDQVAAAGTRHPASQAGYWLAAALG